MFRLPINEQGWGLFNRLIFNFSKSSLGPKAIRLFAALLVLLLIVNGLNIVNSYVGRDFMTALADRNQPLFVKQAMLWASVFVFMTIASVVLRYCEERLGLVWREFMTQQFVDLYVSPLVYYRMNDDLIRQSGVEHPDQRIAEDVKTFTTVTLSFILMFLNGFFTVIAFSSVLWMISPWLFGAAILYAISGSLLTIVLGRRLVDLNYKQLDREAAFRASLIHVRERAESIALLHHEVRLKARILRLFGKLASNWRFVIGVNRKLGFFTTGFNWMIQIIPVLLVAPLYIKGKVEFGVVTQSAMAFAMLVGAFSLIVTQFQSLSSFAAVIQRLISLWYLIEVAKVSTVSGLDLKETDGEIGCSHLTLLSPIDKRLLIKDLNILIPPGERLLVVGDEMARDAFFKALAGIYDAGSGVIVRPPLEDIRFLPDRPYIPPGTLRQALLSKRHEKAYDDTAIVEVLNLVGLSDILSRSAGLDIEQEWDSLLSPHEQRQVSFARILISEPQIVVMANPCRDLGLETRRRLFEILSLRDMTLVIMGSRDTFLKEGEDAIPFDRVLELSSSGSWTFESFTHRPS
jgi:vitamin B12/bleomycin/antimicrobial peptide transport system ATP-binding/permease protein